MLLAGNPTVRDMDFEQPVSMETTNMANVWPTMDYHGLPRATMGYHGAATTMTLMDLGRLYVPA